MREWIILLTFAIAAAGLIVVIVRRGVRRARQPHTPPPAEDLHRDQYLTERQLRLLAQQYGGHLPTQTPARVVPFTWPDSVNLLGRVPVDPERIH